MKKFAISSALVILAMTSAYAATPAEGVPASTNIPEAIYPCVDSSSMPLFASMHLRRLM